MEESLLQQSLQFSNKLQPTTTCANVFRRVLHSYPSVPQAFLLRLSFLLFSFPNSRTTLQLALSPPGLALCPSLLFAALRGVHRSAPMACFLALFPHCQNRSTGLAGRNRCSQNAWDRPGPETSARIYLMSAGWFGSYAASLRADLPCITCASNSSQRPNPHTTDPLTVPGSSSFFAQERWETSQCQVFRSVNGAGNWSGRQSGAINSGRNMGG